MSVERLLSKGKPRIVLHLRKIEVTFIHLARKLVLVSGLES